MLSLVSLAFIIAEITAFKKTKILEIYQFSTYKLSYTLS